VNGGASINILPLSLFKKLGHVEGDLKRTNLSLSGFVGDREQDRAYGSLCGGREGVLQCSARVRLDTCQRVCAVMRWRWSKSMKTCA
jgi:hypothetical protein